MIIYEYQVLVQFSPGSFQEQLNAYAKEGWRLTGNFQYTSSGHYHAILERERNIADET